MLKHRSIVFFLLLLSAASAFVGPTHHILSQSLVHRHRSLTRVDAGTTIGDRPPSVEDLSKGAVATTMKTLLGGSLLAALFLMARPLPAVADGSRIVGELQGSGLVFKDTLQIESFDDPKIKGVTLYISNFQRPMTERLTSNFLADPSYASVACAKTGPVAIADNIAKGKGGEEVFEESRSLLFKTLRVRRIYDEEKKTVIYVSYNTRLDKGDDSNKSRFKSSLCAVSLEQ
jgi:catabolite regulation protein CreA